MKLAENYNRNNLKRKLFSEKWLLAIMLNLYWMVSVLKFGYARWLQGIGQSLCANFMKKCY